MTKSNIISIPLEKYETTEGALFPIYKDWDDAHSNHIPKMIYVTTMNPLTEKGPILHLERNEFVTAITGVVDVEFLIDEKIVTYKLCDNNSSQILKIPAGIPKKFINKSDEVATIINAPDRAWHPDNEDTYKFRSWDEYTTSFEA